MDQHQLLTSDRRDEGTVSEVIRPAAIVPEEAARAVLVELALRDVQNGGVWQSEPQLWSLYDRPWHGYDNPAGAELIGNIQVAYGTPTKYEITLYRVTITQFGHANAWTVELLSDEALGYGGASPPPTTPPAAPSPCSGPPPAGSSRRRAPGRPWPR